MSMNTSSLLIVIAVGAILTVCAWLLFGSSAAIRVGIGYAVGYVIAVVALRVVGERQ